MNARIVILPVTLILIAFCCCGPAWELVPAIVEKTPVKIIDGYSLGKPAGSGLRLYGKSYPCKDDPSAACYPTIVEQSVVKIGWNDDFILVERHPLDTYIFATPDAANPSWFIVVLASKKVYRDLPYEEYTELIKTLNVPHIEMQNAIDVYKQ